MKKRISILAMVVGMLLSFNGFSQKFGHIDTDALLQQMPEAKTAQTELEAYGQQLEKDLADMQTELQNKGLEYEKMKNVWTSELAASKRKEIEDMQARIQSFAQNAQSGLAQKQQELLQPILDKATQAVKDVANEGNYTYIFDSSPSKSVLIFTDNGDDIMDKVKAKLGIQ